MHKSREIGVSICSWNVGGLISVSICSWNVGGLISVSICSWSVGGLISVSICSWNVGGLISDHHNKTIDPLFIKQIQNCDMVLLTETHVGYNTPVNIDGFLYYPLCREKSKNNRFLGDLGVPIR